VGSIAILELPSLGDTLIASSIPVDRWHDLIGQPSPTPFTTAHPQRPSPATQRRRLARAEGAQNGCRSTPARIAEL
jgi:hypothetical protein